MAINNFHFKLDIEREDHIPKFRLKQYDTAIFYASLYKNGLPYHFENEQIKMFVKKADGTIVYQEDNITIQDDEVKINVKNQALTASGLTYAELELKSSSGQVTTATFLFEVREKVGSDKAIESITDICTLEKLDRYVGQAKKELDKFKQDLSKLEDLVANKDKLEGQNTEAKVNIKELERVLEQANNIVDNGGKKVTGNNVVSESSNGYIQDIKLSGRTLVNEIDYTKKQGNGGTIEGNYIVLNGQSCHFDLEKLRGKEFTIIANPQGNNQYTIHTLNSQSGNIKVWNKTGYFIIKHESNSDLSKIRIYTEIGTMEKISLMVLEGDHTQNPPSFFEGMKSVGEGVDEIEILSCNKNLAYDVLYPKTVEYNACCKSKCFLHPNTNYNISIVVPVGEKFVTETSIFTQRLRIDGDGTRKNLNVTTKYNIKTDARGYYTIFFNEGGTSSSGKAYGLQIEFGNKTSDYIMNKQDKRKLLHKDEDGLWKKFILRKWDTIEEHLDNYYYHKRSTLKTLNGSEDWKDNGTTSGECSTFYIRGFSNIKNFKIICDKYNYHTTPKLDTIGISSINDILYLTVKTNYASNVAELKTKLRSNNINLVFEDVEKIYECLNISVRSFNPTTLLSVSSGAIDPEVEYYIPSSFVSSDSSISEKLENVDDSLLKLMFDFISHNHDERYDLKNVGSVTDFNTALEPGRYYVFKEGGSIPNAPYSGNIYGALEVFHTNDTELIQRFTSANGKIYTRLKNFEGNWWTWSNMTNIGDFSWDFNNSTGTGFQKLPSGMIIQFGTTQIGFNDNSSIGTAKIYYPLAFTKFCKCTGNLETNSYGGYNETNAIVGGQTLTNGYAEVRDIQGRPQTGYTATVTWIAIGI
ncbi:MAG: BppU family phage baseplate upper protein [Paeniclostridium sordellii]|nr:BppU family phage baseplate upper protein [Paeniclostridium sordellii]